MSSSLADIGVATENAKREGFLVVGTRYDTLRRVSKLVRSYCEATRQAHEPTIIVFARTKSRASIGVDLSQCSVPLSVGVQRRLDGLLSRVGRKVKVTDRFVAVDVDLGDCLRVATLLRDVARAAVSSEPHAANRQLTLFSRSETKP